MFSFINSFDLFLQINDMSICTLAECIKNDSQYDLNEALEPQQILQIMDHIGCHVYNEESFYGNKNEMEELNVSMKRLILEFIQQNCGCFL